MEADMRISSARAFPRPLAAMRRDVPHCHLIQASHVLPESKVPRRS
jgi:hypothetical protein